MYGVFLYLTTTHIYYKWQETAHAITHNILRVLIKEVTYGTV